MLTLKKTSKNLLTAHYFEIWIVGGLIEILEQDRDEKAGNTMKEESPRSLTVVAIEDELVSVREISPLKTGQ